MPRNPKNPHLYMTNPKGRATEKLTLLFEHFLQFDYSTRQILLSRLGLNPNSHHDYFKKLETKGILRRVPTYTLRGKFVYALTTLGLNLLNEYLSKTTLRLPTDSLHTVKSVFKLSHTNIRHHLAVQKTVISLLPNSTHFFSEKFMPNFQSASCNTKKPDALICYPNQQIALEVELTAKNDKRLYSAFSEHAEGILRNNYSHVLYVFPTKSLCSHYLSKFDMDTWPRYARISENWVQCDSLEPDILGFVRNKFKFLSNEDLLTDL